jgi:prepilin-type N-terminal cleavage/methylation domain-containing protein
MQRMAQYKSRALRRRCFTLVELLVVMSIMAVLAGMVLMALAGATEKAREDRTTSEVMRLHELVMERYEGYRIRPLPVRTQNIIAQGGNPNNMRDVARVKLLTTWELMRMELPERKSDILDDPKVLSSVPSLCQAYRRRLQVTYGVPYNAVTDAQWTPAFQGAECLYLIISTLRDGDTTGLNYFTPREIKDTDGDKMPEIVDAWGMPIEFLRWAPGYISKMQEANATNQPDPFDPLKIYSANYSLTPFIYSAGPDKKYDINVGAGVSYAAQNPANNPYFSTLSPPAIGAPADADGDGRMSWADNFTNHYIVVK